MRYDLQVLWVDDQDTYYRETREILEMYVEDFGLAINISYIQNAQDLLNRIDREQSGFKNFDMFFIDYSLSYGVIGSSVIKKLREANVDSDILFYSSQHEADIRDAVAKDLGSFEGVYIANRDNFAEKSTYLIKKTSKRLSSISNIRGLLTDQTSQNDFIVNSYILHKYYEIGDNHKSDIKQIILDYMNEKKRDFIDSMEIEIDRVEASEVVDIKKLFKRRDFVFPLELKYQIFQKLIELTEETGFAEITFNDYRRDVINLRNKLAHKKLELCGSQRHIIFSDNIFQHIDRMCPPDCDSSESEHKITVDQWDEMRKRVVKYGKGFDAVFDNISKRILIGLS